jgi:AbrB family looped-hinge helix DNA binding protein
MTVYTKIISTQGRITIPPEIRLSLGLKRGDSVQIVLDNGDFVLRKVQTDGSVPDQSHRFVLRKQVTQPTTPDSSL